MILLRYWACSLPKSSADIGPQSWHLESIVQVDSRQSTQDRCGSNPEKVWWQVLQVFMVD